MIVKSMYDLVDFIYSENIFIPAEVCKFAFLVVRPKLYFKYFKEPYFFNERPVCLFKNCKGTLQAHRGKHNWKGKESTLLS